MIHIRPFEERDYPDLAELRSACYPDDPVSSSYLRYLDESRSAICDFGRLVAELDGHVVGEALFEQEADSYHPGVYTLSIDVRPQVRQHYPQESLYEAALEALAERGAHTLVTELYEEDQEEILFFKQRGFREAVKHIELRLPVDTFDTNAFSGLDDKLASKGIAIRSWPELADDPERDRKLFELRNEVDQETPFAHPVTPVDFEWFYQRIVGNPKLKQDGLFVATCDDDYVGMSALYAGWVDHTLSTGLTGVKADYRRKGIALGLKVHAIRYAQEHGYPVIRTWNAASNQGMLSVNTRLGFKQHMAMVEFVKTFKRRTSNAPLAHAAPV